MSRYSEYIKNQYVNLFDERTPFKIEWLDKLIDYLENKVSQTVLENFIMILTSNENMQNMKNGDFLAFGMHMLNVDELIYFLENNNIDSYELENVLELIFQNGIEDSNVIDEFIRIMVINNFDKLTFDNDISYLDDDEEIRMNCLLGKLPICKIELSLSELYMNNSNYIIFDGLLTRKNLKGTKIGELMMKKVFQEMIKRYPERNLIALNVMASNVDGQRFYERLGGSFYEYTQDGVKPILLEEINIENKDENIIVEYTQEIMKQKAYEEIDKPTIDIMVKNENLHM